MKYVLIVALGVGGYFAYKKFHTVETPPPVVADPEKTPGADVKNRINNLSGVVPDP